MNLIPVSNDEWNSIIEYLDGATVIHEDGTEETVNLSVCLDKEEARKMVRACFCISGFTPDEAICLWNEAQQWKEHLLEIGDDEDS